MTDHPTGHRLTRSVTDPDLRAAVGRWRQAGVPEPVVAIGVAERVIPAVVAAAAGHRRVLIVHPPTFPAARLERLVEAVTGLPRRRLSRTAFSADLDEGRLVRFAAAPGFALGPLRATIDNVRWLSALGARPIVCTGTHADLLVAAADQIATGRLAAPIHVPPGVRDGTPEQRRWFAVRCVGPLLVNFAASWRAAAALLPVHWISADMLRTSPGTTLQRALGHAGITVDADTLTARLTAAWDDAALVPRPGAGAALDADQRRVVDEIAAPYRVVNHSDAGV